MRRTTLLAVLTLVLASCGGDAQEGKASESTTPDASASVATATASPTPSPTPELRTDYDIPPWSEIVAMYEYDTSEPLDYKVIDEAAEERMSAWLDPSSARVYDVAYRSSGHTVPAWLVIPDGQGPFPAVLYAHGYTLDRDFFLADAVALAREGYAGLAITGPGGRSPYVDFVSAKPAMAIRANVQYVIDLRRGLDLLGSLPEIDASRIGFVGHSQGCQEGAILSGLEDRIEAYVLMSCVAYTDPTGLAASTDQRFNERIAVLNHVNYVTHNQGAAFLIQGSRTDVFAYVPSERALFAALPEPKTLRWYTDEDPWGGHELGCSLPQNPCPPDLPAFAFHRAWLQRNV